MNDATTTPETLISYSLHDKIVKGLEAKIARWEEINRDELGKTLTLITVMGVYEDVKDGKACMDAMLQRIADYQRVVIAARNLQASLPPNVDTHGRNAEMTAALKAVQ